MRRHLPSRAALLASAALAITLILTAAPAGASGWRLTSHPVAGDEQAAGCLTPTLCVVTGLLSGGRGDAVAVRRGVPGPVSTIASEGLLSVSCPGPAGCVALGQPPDGDGVQLVRIGRAATITGTAVLAWPAQAPAIAISCTSVTSCVVAGFDPATSPQSIVIGAWNGRRLTVRRLARPAGTRAPDIDGLSCAGASCVAVGSVERKNAPSENLIVTISHGRPVGTRLMPGPVELEAVSCTSATRCYAAGYAPSGPNGGGAVVTLTGGVPGPARLVTPILTGIACRGTACVAAGELPRPSLENYGALMPVTAGRPGAVTKVTASGGYRAIGRSGAAFLAVGFGKHGQSEITSG
jgi:hypothetical protein